MDDVFGFDVGVEELVVVELLEDGEELLEKLAEFGFGEGSTGEEFLAEVYSFDVFKYEVMPVLEGGVGEEFGEVWCWGELLIVLDDFLDVGAG